MKTNLFSILLTGLLAVSACKPAATEIPSAIPQEVIPMLTITSSAFINGSAIPAVYTCTGKSISPALAWGEPPAGTQSFALIMDDPDAPSGMFVHWVIYNIPSASRGLPEAFGGNPKPADGSLLGRNGTGQPGYVGPCPPSGTHRYFFKLYALDTSLGLSAGASKDELLKAMQGHILGQGELMGTFNKTKP
jgi:Raf kinase inhibitor-like YbhB/YbcL family protein